MLSVYYVDSAAGNDAWSGLAGSYASGTTGPWQTIAKVNSVAFAAGDSILFKRGDTWREELVCDSGTSGGRITYGDYGDPTAPKPQILGSTERDLTTDWTNIGGNIWSTAPAVNSVTTTGSELLPNPSFASNTSSWSFYKNSPAVATGARTRSSTIPRRQARGLQCYEPRQCEHRHPVVDKHPEHHLWKLLPANLPRKLHYVVRAAGITLQQNTSP